MHRLLTIVMVLGVVGCGDPAGSGDDAPEKPSCDRDEVVAWLEAEHCPEGYVWGVRWEKPSGTGSTLAQYLARDEEPADDGWVALDWQTCFAGSIPETMSGGYSQETASYWRVDDEDSRFNYSYYPAGEDREYRVTCDFEKDLRGIRADIPDGSFERWIWYGDADKPEHESFD